MTQYRRSHGSVWPLALALLLSAGCSRPAGVPAEGAPRPGQAPFDHEAADRIPAPQNTSQTTGSASSAALPFHDAPNIPAGTLLTVRLADAVTAGPSSSDSFQAVVDQPIVVDGNTLIPRGTSAAGKVQASGISKGKSAGGYMRLALQSLRVGDSEVPVETASLFAREFPQEEADGSPIRLEKGRRLTFRLSQGAYISPQNGRSDH